MTEKLKQQRKDANRRWYLRHRKAILAKRAKYRVDNAEKHKTYWQEWYEKNRQRQIENVKRWIKNNRERYNAQRRKYNATPAARQKNLERLYRFIENHPFYNINFLEKLIKINERTVSLDEPIGEDSTRYDLVSA